MSKDGRTCLKPEQATPRIKWWRLKEDNLKITFREKVLEKVRPVESMHFEYLEMIQERRLRDEQFGFMPGRGTADAIFAVRQRMEKQGKQDCIWYL